MKHVLVSSWASGVYLLPPPAPATNGVLLLRFAFADKSERLLSLPAKQWSMLLDAAELYCSQFPGANPQDRADFDTLESAFIRLMPAVTRENMRPDPASNFAHNFRVENHPDAMVVTVDHQNGPPAQLVLLGYLVFFLVDTIRGVVQDQGLKRPAQTVN